MWIITSASVIDEKLQCNQTMAEDVYENAIEKAQDNIAEDFGYGSWKEYLSERDPEIKEESGVYSIYDDNCGHEECYCIEWL